MATPTKASTMHNRAEPLKPRPRTAAVPTRYPNTPPLCPGKADSSRYRRVHSSPQLAISKTAKPSQNTHKLRCQKGSSTVSCGPAPRSHRAKDTNQTRKPAATHHQAEKPIRKKARSEIQAPQRPTPLRTNSPLPDVDQAGSCGW